MKNPLIRIYLAYAAALVVLLTTACSKDKAEPEPNSSWQVDGQTQSSASVLATSQNNELQVDVWKQFSTGTANGSSVVLTFFIPQQVGTFDLAGASARARASYVDFTSSGQNNGLYLGTQGRIIISSLSNGYATGSFTFTGTSFSYPQLTKSITGDFTCKLP